MTFKLFGEDVPLGKAEFSPCKKYRYSLERVLSTQPRTIAWIMLNPSTADADKDDPTIRRCMGFSRQWGYGHMLVGNVFALRATSPEEIYKSEDPMGLDNWKHLGEISYRADKTIVAWGNHGSHLNQGLRVLEFLKSEGFLVYCLGTTKSGQPKHPLYIPSDCELMEL